MIFGYARVSTPQQSLDEQIEKLRRAGAEKIYYEKFTGRTNKRPILRTLTVISRLKHSSRNLVVSLVLRPRRSNLVTINSSPGNSRFFNF